MKGRSAVRCTGWRTATCGAPPAAGKRPARDSPTERPPTTFPARHTNGQCCLPPEKSGERFACNCFFLQLKNRNCPSSSGSAPVATSLLLSAPLNHSSCGRNQRTAESPFTSPSRIPSTASPFPPFPVLGNPSAAKQCKEKKKKDFSRFYVGFSVASFYVL